MADIPPELSKAATGLIGPAIGAAMGVLMRHSQLVQAGQRPFWSVRLLYEVPTVIGMAIIGGGLGAYLSLPELASWAVAGLLACYGPRSIDVLVRAAAAKLGVKAEG